MRTESTPQTRFVALSLRRILLAALTGAALAFAPWSNGLHSAPIVVNTKGGAAAPQAQPLPEAVEGVPLDFEFQAVTEFGPPKDKAVEKLLAKLNAASPGLNPQSALFTESVIHKTSILTHPSLYTSSSGLHPEERVPKEWNAWFKQRKGLFGQVIRSVGRLEVEGVDTPEMPLYANGVTVGTCFVVAPGVVMTNCHVAEFFAHADLTFKKQNRGRTPAVVRVNFAGAWDEDPILFRVTKVLYMAPKQKPDVALLQITAPPGGPKLPPSLSLQTREPKERKANQKVVVCGYPTNDPNKAQVEALFRTLRVKRVSLGELLAEKYLPAADRFVLYHNCTTLQGNSGSPLVDLDTGTVWGLHFLGDELGQANKAELMWRVCEIPEVRQFLGAAATDPPPTLDPAAITGSPVAALQSSRPSLFVGKDRIDETQELPSDWVKRLGEHGATIRRVLPAVGKVLGEDYDGDGQFCTGFMIAPGIVATFESGIDRFISSDRSFKTLPEGGRTKLYVDFAQTLDNAKPQRFSVSHVLYANETTQLALLQLEARKDVSFPEPLPLFMGKLGGKEAREPVFVVGHPVQDARIPAEVNNAVFGGIYGVKRLAPGYLMDLPQGKGVTARLFHDCSTSGGDAGAPLCSLATGKVLGMHLGGQYLVSNYAMPMWHLLEDRKLREIEPIRKLLAE